MHWGVATFEDDCRVLVLGMGLGSIPYLLFRHSIIAVSLPALRSIRDIIGLAKSIIPICSLYRISYRQTQLPGCSKTS